MGYLNAIFVILLLFVPFLYSGAKIESVSEMDTVQT